MMNFLPWKKREKKLEKDREEAEARLESTQKDWEPIRGYTHQVKKEIQLNDWNATAKRMFTGEPRAS